MEIGTTIISTAEYMELRAMKDSLEARKAEIEANADKILSIHTETQHYGILGRSVTTTQKYVGKDDEKHLAQKIYKNMFNIKWKEIWHLTQYQFLFF